MIESYYVYIFVVACFFLGAAIGYMSSYSLSVFKGEHHKRMALYEKAHELCYVWGNDWRRRNSDLMQRYNNGIEVADEEIESMRAEGERIIEWHKLLRDDLENK